MSGKNKYANIQKIMLACTAAVIALAVAALHFLPPFPHAATAIGASPIVTDAKGRVIYAALNANSEWLIPVSLDKMGRWAKPIAISIEDKRFESHGGIDFIAIARAALRNATTGKRLSGASTISSQVIRLCVPSERTYATKLLEFWRAHQLEQTMSKDEILELYLNIAPFGSNIRGIEAASYLYFGKRAGELSLSETTLLISMVRAPSKIRPDRNPGTAHTVRDQSLAKLHRKGIIPRELYQSALAEKIPARVYPMPRRYLHIAARVARNAQGTSPYRSTIDASMQSLIEDKLRRALLALPGDITASAVLVENKTLAVHAYVGNARFGSGRRGSWVDCANAPRSPGSTMKPFIYALAFDRGLLTPASLLADTPLSLKGATPRNFDLRFRGPVSARSALADSLNIPAVRVLRQVGFADTLDAYRRLGFAELTQDASHYADSLALGGCEVKATELAAAYAALCNKGIYVPLAYTPEKREGKPAQIFSEAASYATLDILKDERRLIPLYRELFADSETYLAFKTGTSYAQRDAWTVACTPKYTLVIWFGDPSGAPHAELIGLAVAAPVAVEVMRGLHNTKQTWFPKPKSLSERKVCSLSGLPINPACPTTTSDYYIKGISPTGPCHMHSITNGRLVINWPPELASWNVRFHERNAGRTLPTLRILSPKNLSRFVTANKQVRIALRSEGGASIRYWFLDSEFLCEGERGKDVFTNVGTGEHILSVSDGESESTTIRFTVAQPDLPASIHKLETILE